MRELIMNAVAAADSVRQVTSVCYQFKWLALNNALYSYIALAIGFFIILVSYFFGGGKQNKLKLFLSITLGVVAGALALPLLLKIAGTNPSPVLVGFFILLDFIFVATVTCHMYELVVINTEEAFVER
jgi:hypothetical protein